LKLYTKKAVAAWLDLTESRVRQLQKEGIITEYQPGLYDLKTVNREYINYLRKGSSTETSVDYNAERARLVKVKREAKELDLQVQKGELHSTEDIEKVMTDTFTKFRTHLMAIPAKLSPTLAKKTAKSDIFRLLKSAIDESLEELADFKALFDDIEVTEDEESNL